MTPEDIARIARAATLQARRDIEIARARAEALLKADVEQLARSRKKITDGRDQLKQRPERAAFDENLFKRRLELAQRHVAVGARHVARQRELVARFNRNSREYLQAKAILENFEELLEMHKADEAHILRMLQKFAREEA